MAGEESSLLRPYRVLDLTEGSYDIAGKILGDLGADVIKIEPPEGSPTRNIGPFLGGKTDPQKSLFWFAYNTNKRGITLDLKSAEGKQRFKKLAETADFVFESFPRGYLEGLGLGYDDLKRINPAIIVTSITPFGATGPYAKYKASDLTIWGMGGFLSITGVPERPPVEVSLPQACFHAGTYAAGASMIAHWHREMTGEGQQVIIAAQQCVILPLYTAPRFWEFLKIDRGLNRNGSSKPLPKAPTGGQLVYSCKDGEVLLLLTGGAGSVFSYSSQQLVKYMDENGMASDWLKKFDWVWGYNASTITQETIDRIHHGVNKFLFTKTKRELFEEAIKRRILLAPIANSRDVYENPQLQARDFWVKVQHPELKTTVTYPGPFLKLTETPITYRRRPPLIGEHNEEISAELANRKTRLVNREKQTTTAGKQALEGIKVADFSWSIVGPLAARYLADFGATVVHVESHTRPETQRVGGPYKDNIPGIDRSSLFTMFNTSKYGMSLNMEKPKGKEAALKLIKWADVVLESFTPGAMQRRGLDYETISKIRPDIIYISSSCYGQNGPITKTPGYGQLATAQSGIFDAIGWADRPTMTNTVPHTDYISPTFLLPTIMSALDYRRRTGKGLYIEQSQVEAGVHFFAPPVMDYIANGHVMKRQGNHYAHAAPHGAYPCKGTNRWCTIAVFSEEEWQSFCGAIGSPAWTKDKKFTTFAARKQNEDELDTEVGRWTINLTPEEVMTQLQAKGVTAGVVRTMQELYEDPQLKHERFWRYLDHPVIGVHAHESPPFQLTKTPDRQSSSPCLGQHNEYVYKELLGYSDDEIAEMMIEGAITTEADMPEFKASF
ncbi:MAG: CoA transferase [Dehalococcoidales bacterium]|nr:CoA transferase [Dehalococcoidales bacterium]